MPLIRSGAAIVPLAKSCQKPSLRRATEIPNPAKNQVTREDHGCHGFGEPWPSLHHTKALTLRLPQRGHGLWETHSLLEMVPATLSGATTWLLIFSKKERITMAYAKAYTS